MYRLSNLIRSGLGLLAAAVAALLLAGCVIISDDLLVSDAEAVTPLPASFSLFAYEEDGAGFKPNGEAPMGFTLSGKAYASADGDMTVYFAPLSGDTTYLVAIKSTDGIMYGIGTYADNVIAIDIVLGEQEQVAAEIAGIAGASVTEDGLKVADRAALDAVIALHQGGKLPMTPIVSYVAIAADATPPAKLTRTGDGWVAE